MSELSVRVTARLGADGAVGADGRRYRSMYVGGGRRGSVRGADARVGVDGGEGQGRCEQCRLPSRQKGAIFKHKEEFVPV